jgi:MoaA/NifB/PqqE/SkfB family radical SAM enzyme
MLYNDVTPFSFHVELTDKCNARCPQCSRNVIEKGTGVLKERDTLALKEISLQHFKDIFSDFKFNIGRINFCGNFGDPFFSRDIYSITEWIGSDLINRNNNQNTFIHMHLHTNGGMKSAKWWNEYGKLCAKFFPGKHTVTFSIDGLEDTHHIYRVNTRYKRVVENARAFIAGGGEAEWSFIKFGHNEHQMSEAKKLAVEYGFASFIPVTTQRFYGKPEINYKFNKKEFKVTAATDYASEATQDRLINYVEKEDDIINDSKSNISCQVQRKQELFIDCLGDVHPCCWIGSYIYRDKYIVKDDKDIQHPIFAMRDNRNAIDESLNDIIYDDFFQYTLPESFKYEPCGICVRQCSDIESADVKTVKIRELL